MAWLMIGIPAYTEIYPPLSQHRRMTLPDEVG